MGKFNDVRLIEITFLFNFWKRNEKLLLNDVSSVWASDWATGLIYTLVVKLLGNVGIPGIAYARNLLSITIIFFWTSLL